MPNTKKDYKNLLNNEKTLKIIKKDKKKLQIFL